MWSGDELHFHVSRRLDGPSRFRARRRLRGRRRTRIPPRPDPARQARPLAEPDRRHRRRPRLRPPRRRRDAVSASREQGRTTGQMLLDRGTSARTSSPAPWPNASAWTTSTCRCSTSTWAPSNLVTLEVAKRYQAVPVGFIDDGTVILAMADPTNVLTIDEISMITGMKIRPAAAGAQDVSALISRLNRLDETVADIESRTSPTPTSSWPTAPIPTRRSSSSFTRSSARRSSRAPPTSTSTPRPAT